MPFTSNPLPLTSQDCRDLTEISQSRSLPAGYVFRARLILMLAEGVSFSLIEERLQTTAPTIVRWKQRFLDGGLEGLDTFHPGQKAKKPSESGPLQAVCPARSALQRRPVQRQP